MSFQNDNSTTATEELQSWALIVSHTRQPRTIQIAQTLSLRLPSVQSSPSTLPPPAQQPPPETSISPLLPNLTRLLEEWLQSGEISGNNLVVFINGRTGSLTVVEDGGEWLFEKRGAFPASKEAIEGLERVEVKENEAKRECAICLEEYEVGEEVRGMPCKHWFHEKCVNDWLIIHGSCPLCRFTLQKK